MDYQRKEFILKGLWYLKVFLPGTLLMNLTAVEHNYIWNFKFAGPDLVGNDDDDLDPEEQQRMTIAQAFADDDVIEEFRRDKGADIDKNKPKDLDLTLPGWGEWGGAGIEISKRKKKRY